MSKQDRNKWNQRYAEGSYHKNNPVTLVEDWLPRLPAVTIQPPSGLELDDLDAYKDYDLIIVMWYVNLGLISSLCDCLTAGGYLVCEEHLITDQDVIGPTSLNYRVAPGDLREAVSALDVLLYEESIETNSEGEQVASARVVAKKSE